METMAVKGSPRDMNKWLEVLRDPNVQFPGESSDYRAHATSCWSRRPSFGG
jgi:hypothetical protein